MRILLIEGDSADALSIELMLKSESHSVFRTDLAEEAVTMREDFDIVLAGDPADTTAIGAVRKLRAADIKTPVLVISRRLGIEDKVRALASGGDDYLTKPFHKDEILARIVAVVRRANGHAHSIVRTGDLAINLDARTVDVSGSKVHLTGKEYQMLELLSLRKGMILTKQMFVEHLYGEDAPELKIIEVLISKLRKKLANYSQGKNYIETVWGRGYRLVD